MKKIFAILMLAGLLAMPMIGIADGPTEVPDYDVLKSIQSVVNWVYYLFMIVAVVFFVLGGFKYMTAGGEAEKVKAAWQNIMYALVGVAIALLSKGLLAFVANMLVKTT